MSARTKLARPVAAAIGFAALVGISAANAADVVNEVAQPAVPMEVPPVASWTGPYAGIAAGYGFGHSDDKTDGNKIDTDGFVGGGFAGYNWDTGQGIVAGIEGDLGYNGVEGDNAGTTVKGGLEGSVRARVGYTITPDILAYVTAGGAGKHMSVEEGGIKDSATQLGWTAGAGADVKFTEKLFGRLEYRYSDYGSETFNTGSGPHDVDAKENRIQLGVGIYF